MENFLYTSFSFPTILYTGLLAIVTLYWLFSIVGFFDLDMLDIEVDTELDHSPNLFGSFLNKFRLEGVPVTISLSLLILCSWVVSFLISYEFSQKIAEEWLRVVLGLWVIVLAPLVTAPLVATIISPLKPLFRQHEEQSSKDIIGKIATLRSSKVTATFGEATLHDGGAGLILKVRADVPNQIKRGDKILLQYYNSAKNTYFVVAKS